MANDMNLTLVACIESYGDAGCIGWIESMKGLVVQADSHEKVYDELVTSVKVKLAYDWGIPYSSLIATGEKFQKSIERADTYCGQQKECVHEIHVSKRRDAVMTH
jgi:hypothetical protein